MIDCIATQVPYTTIIAFLAGSGTADLGVKLEKIPGVIKGRFYVSAPLSDSWKNFTPPNAGVTLGRFLHQLVVAFSPTYRKHDIWESFTPVGVLT